MNKIFPSSLLLTICFSMAFGQNDLRQFMIDESGNLNHYVRLAVADQIAFNATQLDNYLGLGPDCALQVINGAKDPVGYTHYRYRQLFKGIPIENSMYIVHVKDGMITGLSGTILLNFNAAADAGTTASIPPSVARELSKKFVGAVTYIEKNAGASNEKIQLVWYSEGKPLQADRLRLAYKVDVYATAPLSRQYIYVDALSGDILGTKNRLCGVDATGTAATGYSGTVIIHSDFEAGTYKLHDNTRGNGIVTQQYGGTDYTSASANWTLSGLSQYALDAHYGAAASYDFYLNNFGRNSIDDSAMQITSYIKSGINDNAYWTGENMLYGKLSANGAGVTGIDVCGHELTHGVTQYTCDLDYFGESGAINESLSDIMGKCIQFFTKPTDINWKLSNDMNFYFRDLSNPNAYGQPDTYLGTNWYNGSSDNGGVHYNSGVGNFMFYLLVNGGKGTNDNGDDYSVTGLGLSKAQQIIYRSQSVYLYIYADFPDWRTACINAATDLYGASSNEVIQVKNAFYAVGVGNPGNAQIPNACNPPGSLSVSSITSSSAVINWGSVTGANLYYIQYKPIASSVWTTTSALSVSTSKSISGLAWGTNYEYRLQTKCLSGYSTYSAAQTFSTTYTGGIYCNTHGNYDGAFEFIDYVSFGTITRTSGADAGGYYNATTLSTNVNKGSTYTLTFSTGFISTTEQDNYSENWGVFIDWNLDHDFTDAGETAALFLSTDAGYNTVPITIPYTATTGSTPMRISMCFGASPSSCAAYDFGEVEDYTLNIQTPVCSETFESNNSKNTAAAIVSDADVLSQISSSTDEDWFSFMNTPAASNMKVKLSNLPANYNLKLYDINGDFLIESKKGGTTNEATIWNTSNVGTYKAKVYGKNGAFSNTQCYTIKVITSGTPFKLSPDPAAETDEISVSLYPNPAATVLNVQIAGTNAPATIKVYTMMGQVLQQYQTIGDYSIVPMQISGIPSGIYLVEISGDGFKQVKMAEIIH